MRDAPYMQTYDPDALKKRALRTVESILKHPGGSAEAPVSPYSGPPKRKTSSTQGIVRRPVSKNNAPGVGAVYGEGMTTGPISPQKRRDISIEKAAAATPKGTASSETGRGRRVVKPKVADTVAPYEAPAEQPRKPSFNAADTIPKAGAGSLGDRLKKGATAEGSSFPDTFGSMYVKDPTTGKNIPREGYYNEAGTFIEGPRIKPHELGTIISHATANIRDPEIRKIIAQSVGNQGGVLDSESGRIGSELKRTGEQKLEGIKARYLESVARINANADVTSAGLYANAKTETGGDYAPKGYQSVTDEEGNLSVFNKDTGTYSAPGAELPEHVLKNAEAKKRESAEAFAEWAAQQDAATRQRLKALGY